jgi:hypothetical protein
MLKALSMIARRLCCGVSFQSSREGRPRAKPVAKPVAKPGNGRAPPRALPNKRDRAPHAWELPVDIFLKRPDASEVPVDIFDFVKVTLHTQPPPIRELRMLVPTGRGPWARFEIVGAAEM